MAGHSHASNVKHKKDRNDKLKSGNFLKLRKKLENLYLEEGSYQKLVSVAREHNFPIEKVRALVNKLENAQPTAVAFTRFLYRSDYQLIWCLEGFFDQERLASLAQKADFFKLEILAVERTFEYFERSYSLRLQAEQNFEDLAFSLFSASVIDKIKRIDRMEVYGFNFEVIFLEKQARDEAAENLKTSSENFNFQTEDVLTAFQPIELVSEQQLSYFLLLKKSFLELGGDFKLFTNTIS